MGATLPDGTSDNLPATKKRRRGGDKKDKEKKDKNDNLSPAVFKTNHFKI